jgi:hypothetical protein
MLVDDEAGDNDPSIENEAHLMAATRVTVTMTSITS